MRYGIWGGFSLFSLLVLRELGATASVTPSQLIQLNSQVRKSPFGLGKYVTIATNNNGGGGGGGGRTGGVGRRRRGRGG
jgi:hypothetical protein